MISREFRYHGDRARYYVVDRDPDPTDGQGGSNPYYLQPLDGTGRWTEYFGDLVHKDLEINPETGAATVTAHYTHRGAADGTLFAVQRGQRDFLHGDMLGTTRVTTNATGALPLSDLAFTAFGEPLGSIASGWPRFGYVGAWGYQSDSIADPTGGTPYTHVGARWYDPSLGRFLMRDPIGVFGGINVYHYVFDAPSSIVDPSGLQSYGEQLTVQGVQSDLQSTVGGTWRVTQHAVDEMIADGVSSADVAKAIVKGAWEISRESGRIVARIRDIGAAFEEEEGVHVLVTVFRVCAGG
jgi:RHS repeat-associated protein